jgi:hypothetical protein
MRAAAYLAQKELAQAQHKTIEAEHLLRAFGPGPRSYADGGWWGFDPEEAFWIWKPGAADRFATAIGYDLKLRASWQPTAEEIAERIEGLTR